MADVFKRRMHKQQDTEPANPPHEIFEGLRGQILHLDPTTAGMAPTPDTPRIWGGMLEMTYPKGSASLVCLRDGTTSLYYSTGGGILGGGGHIAVVSANSDFLAELALHGSHMRPDTDESLPAPGRVVIRALTHDGPMTFEAEEEDLGYGRSPLSPVFHAAHEVITQLRLLQEGR